MQYNPHDYQKYAIGYIESHPISAILLDRPSAKVWNYFKRKVVRRCQFRMDTELKKVKRS